MITNTSFDVIIVGAGPAGLCTANLLAQHDLRIALIDRDDPKAHLKTEFDGRTTAIARGCRKVLERSNIWPRLAAGACPIQQIRTADQNAPFFLHFDSAEVSQIADEDAAFGWIVENRLLRQALIEGARALKTVTYLAPAAIQSLEATPRPLIQLEDGRRLSAPLLIAADGRNSYVRRSLGIKTTGWDYGQSAIVLVVRHQHAHDNIAIEHFRASGPFAILPMQDDENGTHRSSIVWSEARTRAKHVMTLDDHAFNIELAKAFGPHLGHVESAGPRFIYPLGLQFAHSLTGPRTALIADAAHQIHPIAGQGLNLGFRDIAALSELVLAHRRLGLDIGNRDLLRRYHKARMADNIAMGAMTDGLTRLFSNDILPIKLARNLGLGLVNRLPRTRKYFMRRAMGTDI